VVIKPNVGKGRSCLTFVSGATEREVLEGFGATWTTAVAAAPQSPSLKGTDPPESWSAVPGNGSALWKRHPAQDAARCGRRLAPNEAVR